KFSFSRKMRYIIILVGITLYFLGLKHSPSLIRAYIMGVIFIFGKLLYEDLDLEKSLAISFIISVFINPISIYEISFKLSYLALVAIVSIYPYIIKFYKGKSKFIKNIILVATIQIFLTPILIKEFGIIQIFSILSNLVVVPIGTAYITLSFVALLLENFGIGDILFPIVNIVFNLLIKTVEIFTKIPMLSVKYNGNKGEIISIIFYVIIFGIIFFNRKEKR
ncbi:MAG: ComEC/Rec2 family competence protein, partial [Fusobacterium sp.]|nr:ComEC/Rec2 family competence protein [Fusobacterium sp.]